MYMLDRRRHNLLMHACSSFTERATVASIEPSAQGQLSGLLDTCGCWVGSLEQNRSHSVLWWHAPHLGLKLVHPCVQHHTNPDRAFKSKFVSY